MAVATPPHPPLNNIANWLTSSRLLLGIVLFVLIELQMWVACLVVFAVASVTDWLDGYYARKYNLVSALGRMLDPLVDKIVVCGAFIFLLDKAQSGLAAWMVVVVVGREFLITGIRSFMEQQGIPFGADIWGKIKMTLQCVVLLYLFLFFAVIQGTEPPDQCLTILRDILIWTMIIVTAGSGGNYCWKAIQGYKQTY